MSLARNGGGVKQWPNFAPDHLLEQQAKAKYRFDLKSFRFRAQSFQIESIGALAF
jgi:hypothetical protein